MMMTAEEICRHYTQAANKAKDIQVLADLNATDTASIRAVLIDGGLLPPDKAGRKRTPEARAELAEEIAKALDEGLDDKTVAERVGCHEQTVKNHRRRREHRELMADQGAPAAQECRPCIQESKPDTGMYDRIEQILAALPKDASEEVRRSAADLCAALFRTEMEKRLGVTA